MDLAGVVVAEADRDLEEENLVDKEVTLISLLVSGEQRKEKEVVPPTGEQPWMI